MRKKEQIIYLKNRIKDLEERLCPCSQHTWIKTGTKVEGADLVYSYKCKVCGKEITSYFIY